MTIYSALTNKTMEEIEQEFANKGYGDFKRSVADALINEMEPFKARYEQIINSGIVDEVLKEGQIRASKAAKETLKRVQQAVGLYTLK